MSVCAGADPTPNSCGKSGEGVGWGRGKGKMKEKEDLKGRRKLLKRREFSKLSSDMDRNYVVVLFCNASIW